MGCIDNYNKHAFISSLLGNDLTKGGRKQIQQAANERKTFTDYAKLVGLDEYITSEDTLKKLKVD